MDLIQRNTVLIDTYLLRRLITERGMTAREFAVSIGVSPFTIWRTLSGKTTPRIETLKKICETLNVTVADVLVKSLYENRLN